MSDEITPLAQWLAAHQAVVPVEIVNPESPDIFSDLYDVSKMQVLIGRNVNGVLDVVDPSKCFDKFRTRPRRLSGNAVVQDLQSFIKHVNRFSDEQSAVWCHLDDASPSLTAVLDYHEGSLPEEERTPSPRFGVHRTIYNFPLSAEWLAWRQSNGKSMDQLEFARFIEDRILDVVERTHDQLSPRVAQMSATLGGHFAGPGRMVELSRGMSVHSEEDVRQAVNLSSGESQIAFAAKHVDDQGAPVKVPNLFLIAVPIFRSGALYLIPVRLRYRLVSQRLKWSYEMSFVTEQFEDAIREAAAKVEEETALPVFFGTPE